MMCRKRIEKDHVNMILSQNNRALAFCLFKENTWIYWVLQQVAAAAAAAAFNPPPRTYTHTHTFTIIP